MKFPMNPRTARSARFPRLLLPVLALLLVTAAHAGGLLGLIGSSLTGGSGETFYITVPGGSTATSVDTDNSAIGVQSWQQVTSTSVKVSVQNYSAQNQEFRARVWGN